MTRELRNDTEEYCERTKAEIYWKAKGKTTMLPSFCMLTVDHLLPVAALLVSLLCSCWVPEGQLLLCAGL